MQIIDDWLEDWLLQVPGELRRCAEQHDADTIAGLAERLGQEASLEGYGHDMLLLACGGDVEAFLRREAKLTTPQTAPLPFPVQGNAPSAAAMA